MTAAEYRQLQAKPAKANKFNARRTPAGFDSQGEEQRYHELALLERLGKISGLECQKRIDLTVGGTHLYHEGSTGRQQRRITYTADFGYIEDGCYVLEDFKGCDTRESRLKRQIVRAMGFNLLVTHSPQTSARAARKAIFKAKTSRLLSKANPQGHRHRTGPAKDR